jgi:CRP-like cAMP-binding protein
MYDLLSKSPLFPGISEDQFSGVFSKITFRVKGYRKGEVIALRDDPCNHLLVILKGSVKGEMLDFSGKTIKGKLAQYILSISKPGNHRVSLPKTQQEMAEFFGVTRPALARVMGELEKERIIQVKRKEFSITDLEKLMTLVR